MSDAARRKMLLQRLHRVRAIERRQAMQSLTDAQASWQHLAALADRTRGLANDYAGRRETASAADLQTLFGVRAHLERLASSAQAMGQDAELSAHRAGEHFVRADSRLDIVARRLSDEVARVEARALTEPVGVGRQLARRLQGKPQTETRSAARKQK